jgi:hypothetical protein
MMPTAIGPMIPARITTEDKLSASDKNVKNDIKIKISTTASRRGQDELSKGHIAFRYHSLDGSS